MKRTILTGLMLLSGFIITAMENDAFAQLEYLKVCSLYGAGWYYIPGSDTCLYPTTGDTRHESSTGTVQGKSLMAYRVTLLEQRLDKLIQKYKNQIKDDRSQK